MTKYKNILLAMLSGILFMLAYPNFNLEILAWASLVPLLYAIKGQSPLKAFGLGWLTGFTIFSLALIWLKVFHISVPFVISAYLALFFGLTCMLYRFIQDRLGISEIFILPVVWVAIEFIRSSGPWGFPAGVMGYSQYLNIPLIQIADITGVYGVSFLVILVNTVIFSLLINFSPKRFGQIAVSLIIIMAAVFGYGQYSLSQDFGAEEIKIAAIQPNFNFDKEHPYDSQEVLNVLSDLTLKAAKEKPDLVIWPESVIAESIRSDLGIAKQIFNLVRESHVYLLLGNRDILVKDDAVKHYNSAILISPDGTVLGQYNKIHPVPFWEIIPVRYYLSFLKNTEAKGTCDRGQDFTVFNLPKGKFSGLICFEGIFPPLVKKFVNNGSQLLVNITNDGWSKSVTEHYQHASMNVFRAVENRIYYVRAGNTGFSAVIDPYGRIIKSLPVYERGYLVANVKSKRPIRNI